jgi:hypothetical protein
MKMLATKMAVVTSVALATLLAAEAAHAQRYEGSRSYNAVEQSAGWNRGYSNHDQQVIDEITRTDEDAGK